MDISIVALIASIVSICLAFFAIWQANHHRDKSDKLNRDTTEKLARIEAFATSTKEDAFAEIKRWGDFARAGGKAMEEAEKAKEEELRKLKDELRATSSEQINKVLQTVESKLGSSMGASTISEIKEEFEELKQVIVRIQEKGLGEVKRLKSEQEFMRFWLWLPLKQRDLLAKLAEDIQVTSEELEMAGITRPTLLHQFIAKLTFLGALSEFQEIEPDKYYAIILTPEFRQFLRQYGKR